MAEPRYAAGTDVSSDRSKIEIEKTLARYGADQFMYATEVGRAVIAFRAHERHVRFTLPMPDRRSPEFVMTPAKKYMRSPAEQERAYEQAVKERWRALALVVKAKLEAVRVGITVFEDEFMAHIVLPDNRTVSEWLSPQIERAYVTGEMPARLALPPPEER